MVKCSLCESLVPGDSTSCPECGAPLEEGKTRTLVEGRVSKDLVWRAKASHPGETRFVPGAVLAGRYRIVTPLGRGGMGEVYRAEDLRLGQAVALKFLPERLAGDRAAVSRFHQEARLARQISHPNVCRVFDIGDADGQLFLAMEYIDGEDLAALLRRIGRLPVDKGLEIAQQLCAGLAAIHDSGILHRDLKPANVMIDSRGRARITDFGISALADDGSGEGNLIGTPSYMAPEQLARGELTNRTDLYALGLILYELLTGHRVSAGSTPREIAAKQAEKMPIPPSALVREIDSRTDQILMQCLQRDPALRPASALRVAAGLPGLEPLAAAVAAGETPSPEMVAASGKTGALRLGVATSCLAAVILLSAGSMLSLRTSSTAFTWEAFEPTPEFLISRARDLLAQLGYHQMPVSTNYGYSYLSGNRSYVQSLLRSGRSGEARTLAANRAPTVAFFYRESLHPSVPNVSALTDEDPPTNQPGDLVVWLDPQGRLRKLVAIPTVEDETSVSGSRRQVPLLGLSTLADLDPGGFVPAENKANPPVSTDTQGIWRGSVRDPSGILVPLRIEGGGSLGRPVYFSIAEQWPVEAIRSAPDPREGARSSKLLSGLYYFFFLTVSLGGLLLARRNLRLRRGDTVSASRFAGFTFAVCLAGRLPFVGELWSQAGERFWLDSIGSALTQAALVWVCYMALEPMLRRFWPERIISWSRLLGGSLRDPLVGRDLLIGCLLGVGVHSVFLCRLLVAPSVEANLPGLEWVSTIPQFLNYLTDIGLSSILMPLCFLVFLLTLRILVKSERIAALILCCLLAVVLGLRFQAEPEWIFWSIATAAAALFTFAWTRFGLLAGVVQWLTLYLCADGLATATHPSCWFFWRGLLAVGIVYGLAVYGFVATTAGQLRVRDEILDS